MIENPKQLVLLYHGAKEGRGAWFDLAHRAALTRAANESHYLFVEIDQVKLDQINPDLPASKMTADAKPVELPVMLCTNFEQLLALAEAGKAGKPTSAAGKPGGVGVPAPWSAIVAGSVVLASDAGMTADGSASWWRSSPTRRLHG